MASETPVATASETAKIPATQKSWRAVRAGEPEKALALSDNTPVPSKLKKGEILVKVQAAALNPVGYKVLGFLPSFVLKRVNAYEFDFAGIVADANGTELKDGDEVVGTIPVPRTLSSGWGALAQYTKALASEVVPRPKNVTSTQAAGFGIAGLTAYQALEDVAKLEAGQSVFINGGSTAVGSFAIQLAKAKGAKVAASASGKNEQYVRDLGADEFFDYTKAPLHEQLAAADPNPKFHVFLEAVGILDPTLFVQSPAYLAPGGVFISVGPQGKGISNIASFAWKVLLQPSFLGGTKRKWRLVSLKPTKKDWEAFTKLVEEGKVKPLVDSVFAFEDTLKAYERIRTGRATGKVVVKVDPNAE
ncbi:NAD-P-binding protein [Polyporus arcularius HHB13444]|uniref:NAD-P-binding protein n=1 Tax=Polyporus arcularius HHB13444 TaxID=1314778 RepID=A0A5C3Q4U9_9APHY|nr:NAD-P-binding protein [Polyporus arcularius HHB13444]